MPYDAQRDLVSVAKLVNGQSGFALGPMSGARSWPEYVAWVKANPDKAFFASSGVGSHGSPGRRGARQHQRPAHRACRLQGIGPVQRRADGRPGLRRHQRHRRRLRIPPQRQAAHRRDLGRRALARAARRADVQGARRADGAFALVRRVRAGRHAAARSSSCSGASWSPLSAELTERFVSLGLDPAAAGPKATAETLAADYARWRPIVQQAGFKLD